MANEFKVKKGLIVDGSNTVLDVQGTQGQLFSVTDSLTGDLFSVSDVSGIPILNVNSSGIVDIDGKLGVGTNNPGAKLEVDSDGTTPILRLRYNANYYTDYNTNGIDATGTNQTFAIRQNGSGSLSFDASQNATFAGDLDFNTGHGRDKIDLNGSDAHTFGTESYHNTYGPNTWNSGTIGHKFYANTNTLIATIGEGGDSNTGSQDSRFYGNLQVDGDLNITGDINSTSVTNLDVDDKTITIAKGAADSAAADGAGIVVDGASASLLYDHTGTQWEFNKKVEVAGEIKAGIAGNSSANTPALRVYANGASSSNKAAIAIQQGTSEGDTIIFADYEPHVEWGISAQNSTDQIHFTAGSSTNSLGTKTFYNNAGSARTAYIKFNHDLTDGTTLIGGDLTAKSIIKSGGTSSQYLMADGSVSTITNNVTGSGTDNRLALWDGTSAIDSDADFYVGSSTLHVTALQVTSHDAFYKDTINSSTGGESWNASNGWHRIIEITGSSGRGKCRFLIQTYGGSGTPCRVEGIVNTAWGNANSTLTILHNSYPNFITDIRVVRNSTSGDSFVDIKGSGEDSIVVTILPDGSTSSAVVNFTNVNTLPTGDAMELHQTLTNMIMSMSSGTGTGTGYDGNAGSGKQPFQVNFAGNVFAGAGTFTGNVSSTNFFTSTNLNNTGDTGLGIPTGQRLGFDQSGTRSWTMKADGGNLNVFSGDGSGGFNLDLTDGLITNTIKTRSGDLDVKTVLTSRDIRMYDGNNDVALRVKGDGTGVEFDGKLLTPQGYESAYGVYTDGGTHTNKWQKVLSVPYASNMFGYAGFNLDIMHIGETSGQGAHASIYIQFKFQSNNGRLNANIINYGETEIDADHIAIRRDHSNLRIELYHKITTNYTSPRYSISHNTTTITWYNTVTGDDTALGNTTDNGFTELNITNGFSSNPQNGAVTFEGDVTANVANNGFVRAAYDANNMAQLQANSSGGVFGANAGGTTKILLRSYGDSYFTGGDLGVGTSNPSNKLHVVEGTGTWEVAELQSSSTTGSGVTLVGADTGVQWSMIANASTGGAGANNLGFHLTGVGTSGGSTGYKMTIKASSGHVGISTVNPRYQLDLAKVDDAAQTDYLALGVNNGPSGGGGTNLGTGIVWKPHYSGYSKRSAGIMQTAEANYFRSGLAFFTNNQASASSDWVERMRLNMDGKLTLDPGAGVASGGTVFDVQGSEGQLFSVTNSLSGDLFSVSDVSGVPILNVNSNGDVDVDGELNIKNAATRFISLNYEDSVNSIISHSGTNYGLETLHIRGDQIKFYTDYDTNSPKGDLTLTLDTSHNATFTGMVTTNSRFNASTQALHFPNYTGSQGWQIGSDSTAVGMYLYNENGVYAMKLTKTGDAAFAGSVTSGGNLYLAQYIYHNGDTNTNINFESSQITIATSGGSHIQINNDENIYFNTNGTNRFKMDTGGTFIATNDIVAFGSVSDKSYKENIKPITGALELVNKLKGVTFDWKEDTDTNKIVGIKEDIGFIAQDVQEVLPTLVRENDNGKLSIRDKGIVPVLVEAIKELKEEIEQLKKQINNG